MPLYRALERCYVAGELHEVGEEFEFKFTGHRVPRYVEEIGPAQGTVAVAARAGRKGAPSDFRRQGHQRQRRLA